MARGKKTGGKNFEKGHPGGPGRPATPPDLTEARKLNRTELERLLNAYIWMNQEEVHAKLRDRRTTNMERMVAALIERGIKDGDSGRLTFLLDRLIGPVRAMVEVSTPAPFVIHRRNGDQVALGIQPPPAAWLSESTEKDK